MENQFRFINYEIKISIQNRLFVFAISINTFCAETVYQASTYAGNGVAKFTWYDN